MISFISKNEKCHVKTYKKWSFKLISFNLKKEKCHLRNDNKWSCIVGFKHWLQMSSRLKCVLFPLCHKMFPFEILSDKVFMSSKTKISTVAIKIVQFPKTCFLFGSPLNQFNSISPGTKMTLKMLLTPIAVTLFKLKL